MFLGTTFCGGSLSCAMMPTEINSINRIELTNGIYDDLYISKSTSLPLSHLCPDHWDFDTILFARFNGNTNAGNVDWNLETVSHLLIKKRLKGEFAWKTIETKEIHVLADFRMNNNDYTNRSWAEYEVAVVPVLYGIEGNYSTTSVSSHFSGVFIIKGGKSFHTDITDGYCDTTRNYPSANVELLYNKYPVFVRNTAANYDTGTCSGSYIEFDENHCSYNFDNTYARTAYQKDMINFITDGEPSILKLADGRMWIVQITPNPTDTAENHYLIRKISFSWVEVGDVDSEKDLYRLGLSDVTEEWWNK